jgi:outer membrane immunogenic protein
MAADAYLGRCPRNWGWGCGMTISGLWAFARAAHTKAIAGGLVAMGVAAAGAASAADMLPAKAPAAQAPYNWSGCYLGGYFGWGTANNWQSTDNTGFNPNGINPWQFSLNSTAIGGGYAGCNWQPSPGGGFVLGLEGEGGYMQLSIPGQQLTFGGLGASNVSDAVKMGTGYGLIAGRLGWVFLEKIHVYGKVGVAFFNDSSSIVNGNPALGPVGVVATGSKSQTPLAFGGGAEYPLTQHWIGKAEYLVFEKGSSYTAVSTIPGRAPTWTEDPSTVQTFKLGAAYKF